MNTLNANETILKKFNDSFIIHFHFRKYSFSIDTLWINFGYIYSWNDWLIYRGIGINHCWNRQEYWGEFWSMKNNFCRMIFSQSAQIVLKHIKYKLSECCKLMQKEYKTRHDCVRKVIHRELCKKFKFDHTNKWYMHNSESVIENETHKFPRDFEIQTDHLISARRPDLMIVNKKKVGKENLPNSRLCYSGWPLGKTGRNRKERSYLPTPPLGQDMTQGQFLSGV